MDAPLVAPPEGRCPPAIASDEIKGQTELQDSGILIAGFVNPADLAYDEPFDKVEFNFGFTRRTFVKFLGAGLMFAVAELPAAAQDAGKKGGKGNRGGGFGGGPPAKLAARLHLGKDGTATVFTGKVECGQGSRTEISQAAAEELHLPFDKIVLVMADTALVPDDGLTAGSGTTPRTLPAVRQAAATALSVLLDLAAKALEVDRSELEARDGKIVHKTNGKEQTYAELVSSEEAAKAFAEQLPTENKLVDKSNWKTMGVATPRPNRHALVTGKHEYPSDIKRPGMLYGKVLRAPTFGLNSTPAKLNERWDAKAAINMDGVIVVQDGGFVGVVAPTKYLAAQAIDALAKVAEWEPTKHPSSSELFQHLDKTAKGVPANSNTDELAAAAKTVKQEYHVSYVQHAPMEPRAAVAEWDGDSVTVWTATQGPFRVKGELVNALRLNADKVRVIVPDFGGGFGGRHSGESAIEAARLAKGAGKPVSLQWTRQEEFTWAQFRYACLIKAEASLDAAGKITSWYCTNINGAANSLAPNYRVGKSRTQVVAADAPLRHGSYRALCSTANTFAQEVLMDELAEAAGKDPVEFRLTHLDNSRIEHARLRGVLEEAAKQFNWTERRKQKRENIGIGLACGADKGSVVACCVEVEIDPKSGEIKVRKVCEAFECGTVVNPENVRTQIDGAIIMGLGPALREETKFENGQMLNAAFAKYLVPRFDDVPEIDVHVLNVDSPSAGAGETPIIAIAPAISNAVFNATGKRVREMPIRLPAAN